MFFNTNQLKALNGVYYHHKILVRQFKKWTLFVLAVKHCVYIFFILKGKFEITRGPPYQISRSDRKVLSVKGGLNINSISMFKH